MKKRDPFKYLRDKYHASAKYQKKKAYGTQYHKDTYNKRKELGICVLCGKREAQKNRVMCTECLLYRNQMFGAALENKDKQNMPRNERRKILYSERKSKGICVKCGKNKALGVYVLCASCIEKNKQYIASSTQRKIEQTWSLLRRDNRRKEKHEIPS